MEMQPVESSNIAAIGHDPDTNELHVEFKNGAKHSYADVPPERFQMLLNADSVGKHFNAHVKGRFDSKPLVQEDYPGRLPR